jgi:hypothetical protein
VLKKAARLAEVLRERAARRGEASGELRDLLTRATVGAAWACVKAILRVAFAAEDPSSAGGAA